MEWIVVLITFLAIYVGLLQNQLQVHCLDEYRLFIVLSPIIFVAAFGVIFHYCIFLCPIFIDSAFFLFQIYSVWTILYRVFTFNDCPEAAAEIQRQIKEAKADLTAKGFKFDKIATAASKS